MPSPRTPWASTAAEVVDTQSTHLTDGLAPAAAATRLSEVGPNVLAQTEGARWYQVLGRQFADILIAILVVAAVISLALGEVGDAVTIGAIILLNGVLGFVQEWRAEQALQALREMLTPTCKVIRAGEIHEIAAEELVPGDLVRIDQGDRVPADLRLVEIQNLSIEEAALTGESLPVDKTTDAVNPDAPLSERKSMAYTSTAVARGHATGVVVATGMKTEFGRVAELTQLVGTETTHLQRKLGQLGKVLGVFSIGVSALVVAAGAASGRDTMEMFFTGVALAVAVVPEGLPAVVTITLAVGVRQMLKRQALIRKLQATETLGAATVICTDKTGTLTQNQMMVSRVRTLGSSWTVSGSGYEPQGEFTGDASLDDAVLQALLTCAVGCNEASVAQESDGWHALGAPTEAALMVLGQKAGVRAEAPIEHEVPFDSQRKRMTVIRGGQVLSKGAPEVLLPLCDRYLEGGGEVAFTEETQAQVLEHVADFAGLGLRTLALARRELPSEYDNATLESSLVFLGIVGIIDPPRVEVADAIQKAHQAGIRTVMVTGDNARTAEAIAHDVGLRAGRVITGPKLEKMNDDALTLALGEPVLFARVSPEHKLRIVEAFQRRGDIVAMTGDGVNDAPALKRADIGIAMGERGTEVARGAADMILTDDNFASIVRAVEEGRRQYDNIQKFVRYLLTSNTGEVIAIALSIFVGGPLVLLPVQILWTNLITDGVVAVALGAEPVEEGTMRRPPRDPAAPLLDLKGYATILGLGAYIGLATYGLFAYYLDQGGDAAIKAQTVAFTALIIFEKINVFNFRSLHSPLFKVGFFTNPWIIVAWVANMLIHLGAVYLPFMQDLLHTVPLAAKDWLLIFAVGLPIFAIGEIAKLIYGATQKANQTD